MVTQVTAGKDYYESISRYGICQHGIKLVTVSYELLILQNKCVSGDRKKSIFAITDKKFSLEV